MTLPDGYPSEEDFKAQGPARPVREMNVVGEVVGALEPRGLSSLAIAAWAKVMIENGYEVSVTRVDPDPYDLNGEPFLKGTAW